MLLRSNFSHLQNAIFRGFYGPSRELQTFCIAETSQTELKLTTAVIPLVMQFLNSDEFWTYKSLIFFTIITKPSVEVRFNQIYG